MRCVVSEARAVSPSEQRSSVWAASCIATVETLDGLDIDVMQNNAPSETSSQ